MGLMETLEERYSCRDYLPREIEQYKINRLIAAAELAPSANNLKDTRFVLVTSKDKKNELAIASNNQMFLQNAGLIIAACSNSNHVMRCGVQSAPINAAIALENMALQAVEEGLTSCWIGSFYMEKVREILEIPSETKIYSMMAVGYPFLPQTRRKKGFSDSSDRFFLNNWKNLV